MPIHVRVLGSSSSGNCTLVWNERAALLVDCGFPPRYILRHLANLGVEPSSVAGVLITHSHSDHIHPAAVDRFAGLGIPVICPETVFEALARRGLIPGEKRSRCLKNAATEIGPFDVLHFGVPHDAPGGCYGYSIAAGEGAGRKTAAIATDLGFAGDDLVDMFAGADVIVVESNHDPDMLERSGRPAWLKERIRTLGHLSNDQCADFLLRVAGRAAHLPHTVVLAHISKQCNTIPLALGCTRDALQGAGLETIRVLPSYRWEPNEPVLL